MGPGEGAAETEDTLLDTGAGRAATDELATVPRTSAKVARAPEPMPKRDDPTDLTIVILNNKTGARQSRTKRGLQEKL